MKISLQSLKQGIAEFNEKVEPDFLDETYQPFYPEILRVHARVDKFDRDYRVDITLRTIGHFTCDRCLEDYSREITLTAEHIFRVIPAQRDDDEIIEIPADATEIDLTPFLEELLILEHPIKMLCKEDCKGLCPGCGVNLNHESCRCSDDDIDPRWEELRKLIK